METGDTEEQVGTLRSRWEIYRTGRDPIEQVGGYEVRVGLLRGQ